MRRAITSGIFILAVIAMGYISFTQRPGRGETSGGIIAITGGRLVAGPGQPPVENAVVVIEHGRIKSIFPQGKGEIPAGANLIDARGASLSPGLMDCRVNLLLGSAGVGASAEEFLPDRVIQDLRANLYWGITTVQSEGDSLSWMMRLRDNEQNDSLLSPRLRTSGPLLTAIGGYPACYLPSKISQESTRELKDLAHSREAIASLAEQKVNAISVVYEGEAEAKPYPKLALPLLQQVILKARDAGLRVSARIGRLDDLKNAVRAGVAAVEFTSDETLDAEALQLMRGHGTYYISALTARLRESQSAEEIQALIRRDDVRRTVSPGVLKGLGGNDNYFYRLKLDPQAANYYRSEWKACRENLSLAARNQVKIVLGTGAGHPAVFHGLALHDELQLLTAAGLTNLQAIDSATRIAAEYLGIDGVTGTIEPGKMADIVITEGNLLEDIGRSRAIQWVIKGGKIIERGKLLQ